MSIKDLTLEQLTAAYSEIKHRRSELSRQDGELKDKQTRIEIELGDRCLEMNVDSFKVNNYAITRTLKRTAVVENGKEFLEWAQINNRMDLVQIKHFSSPIKDYMSENAGELPQGMAFVDKFDISIRKI